ncbi:hypothetical protein A9D60_16785 [Leisingera sp. JC1]|nr:hypothetical protein A9D60_16785 [Leisingera sp. JC1]
MEERVGTKFRPQLISFLGGHFDIIRSQEVRGVHLVPFSAQKGQSFSTVRKPYDWIGNPRLFEDPVQCPRICIIIFDQDNVQGRSV